MKRKLLKFLTVLFCLYYVSNGVLKLISHPHMVENFEFWGYSHSFMFLIGAVEIAGGILLLFPKTAWAAAIGLICIMFGAIGTHLIYAEWLHALIPIAAASLLWVVALQYRSSSFILNNNAKFIER